MFQGYIQVYTGNGKGKTTAATGLALRAIGAGLRVYIAQFIKHRPSGEMLMLGSFTDQVSIIQFGGGFVRGVPSPEHVERAQHGLRQAHEAMLSGNHQVIILDEINVAVYQELIALDQLLDLIEQRPEQVELVLTGRNAHAKVIELADLVTEMREVKHYYKAGVSARKGIEK